MFFFPFPFPSLSDFADVANVVIAGANLFLAGYIFLYQFKKDKKTGLETAKLNEQNIKLQWFKQLIVEPNLLVIDKFYTNLQRIRDKITSDNMSAAEKEDLNEYIKAELSTIRKSFTDVLLHVDKRFANKILANLDALVDGMTEAIFNEELKLTRPTVFEKHVGSKISYSRNNIIALLYNYKGIAE